MEQLMKEVKTNVIGLVISAPNPLSVKQLAKDFRDTEGKPIPYRQLGFNSLIQLLQGLSEFIHIPENANENSIVSLVENNCDKSNHLRILIEKQKNSKKRQRSKSSNGCNSSYNNYSSCNNYSSYNNNSSCSTSQRNGSYQSNGNNRGNNYSPRVTVSPKNQDTGYVTNELKQYLEKTINNNGLLTVDCLKQLVKKHKDFPLLKANNMEDVKRLLSSFLEINGSNVVLKNTVTNGTRSVPHTNGYNNNDNLNIQVSMLKSGSSPGSRGTFADLDVEGVTDLLSKLRSEGDMENSSMTESVKTPTNRLQKIDGSSFMDLNTPFRHSTPKENENSIVDMDDGKLSVYEKHCIPKKVLLNITRIFSVYNDGISVDNFELLYNILFDTFFYLTTYGFETTVQLFKVLPQMVQIRNNVLYKKNDNELSDCTNLDRGNYDIEKQENIICVEVETKLSDISLDIEQKLVYSETKMVLAEIYDPSLFYLHVYADNGKFTDLMDQMKLFYNKDDKKYVVNSDHIFAGLTYVSSYTSFSREKQWFRVRVLGEVDSTMIKVIHVDYGTVDIIPKTELKFLAKKFSSLPCQAIRCCLTFYNELGSIEPEVTHNFLELINNTPLQVQIDRNFIFKSYCAPYQILHVTLLQQISESKYYININRELLDFLPK